MTMDDAMELLRFVLLARVDEMMLFRAASTGTLKMFADDVKQKQPNISGRMSDK